jgi:hypothetical protein
LQPPPAIQDGGRRPAAFLRHRACRFRC